FNFLVQNRDKAFVIIDSVLNLIVADFGAYGIGANDEGEYMGFFDGSLNLIPPIGSWGNIFPIDPNIMPVFLKASVQLCHEFRIASRIRDKDIRHYLTHPLTS